jgi:hypothetical protein
MYTDSQYRAPSTLTANIVSESTAAAPVFLYQLNGHSALPGVDLLHNSGINVSGQQSTSDFLHLSNGVLL